MRTIKMGRDKIIKFLEAEKRGLLVSDLEDPSKQNSFCRSNNNNNKKQLYNLVYPRSGIKVGLKIEWLAWNLLSSNRTSEFLLCFGPHCRPSEDWSSLPPTQWKTDFLFFEEGKTGISGMEDSRHRWRWESITENKEFNTDLYVACWKPQLYSPNKLPERWYPGLYLPNKRWKVVVVIILVVVVDVVRSIT